jgi:two-component system, LytTR family, sensor kinase
MANFDVNSMATITKLNVPVNQPNIRAQFLFWILVFFIGFYIRPNDWDLLSTIIWSLGNTLFFVISVNLNLFYLLPKFMFGHSFLSYLAVLLGLSLLLTPFLTMFNFWFISVRELAGPKWMIMPHFHFVNLLILTALSSLVRIPLDWLKIETEKNELVTKNIETELQSLKNQINPHFLFNTLNNLYALTLKKSDLAPEIVLKLSDMMRYMLYECNESEVLMEKEFKYIENYIQLEKLRHSSNTDIQFYFDDQLMEYQIAPLLLIPFVENSFKHGLRTSLEIDAHLETDQLIFKVKNSKPTIVPGHIHTKKQGGVGLVNVKKRLSLLYNNRYTLDIEDMPDIYAIQLSLVLKHSET